MRVSADWARRGDVARAAWLEDEPVRIKSSVKAGALCTNENKTAAAPRDPQSGLPTG
jgi:hypothetical protein